MISQSVNITLSLLKYLLPILLAGGPLLALYGAVAKPIPAAIAVKFPDKYAVLVGLAASCTDSCTSRSSYALFPSRVAATVATAPDGKTELHTDSNGLIGLLFTYGLCGLGTWWLWRRRHTPPNNSSTSNPLRGSA